MDSLQVTNSAGDSASAGVARPKKRASLSRDYFAELRGSKKGMTGALILAFMVLVAITAPVIAPHDASSQSVYAQYAPPLFAGGTMDHILGADNLGRDILSRTIYGTQISLSIAFIVIFIAVSVGAVLGAIAGYVGGIVDTVIMRIADFQLSFPFILLALVFMAILGPGYWSLVIALTVAIWANYARLVRGEALKIRELEFVQAAKAIGVSRARIIWGHILPNALPALIVLGTLDIAWVIITEAALSFLGLGIQPPTPSWGVMLNDARGYLYESAWMTIFPGIALFMTCIGVNLLGDWLRDTFDPKMAKL
ncbi:MAG: ABC transporter permease [Chloroflexi bacterium]|nr:ABC transporter permease [Chloroflexota bacterium]